MVANFPPRAVRTSERSARNLTRAIASALGLALAPAAGAQSYQYLGQFGVSGAGTLNFPSELAFDPATRDIYVTDTGNNRVVVFDANGGYLRQFGGSGTADGEFNWPAGIAVDPVSHHVIVADYFGHRVQSFDANGGFLGKFAPDNSWNPCGLAVRPSNRDIIVSTGYGANVLVYDVNGSYSGFFGSPANFNYACDLTIAPDGTIYVADETNNNVQHFSAGGSPLGSFGGYGSGDGQMNGPGGVGVDPISGNIVVVDASNDRIEIFDPSGNYLAKFGGPGQGPAQFDIPIGLAFDPLTHDLLVADRSNNRVQRFASCGGSLVSLSVLPLTQALGQATFFSVSVGNVERPGGTVAIYADGTFVCSAANGGDPQAACSGLLSTGTHTVTAVWSGDNLNPSGCSAPVQATVIDNATLAATTFALDDVALTPQGLAQGQLVQLTGSLLTGARPAGANAPTTSSTGFVTFYDGTSVIALVPLDNNQAVYTNAFAAGTHHFSATYSGDGNYETSSGGDDVVIATPDSEVFYSGFEVPPGN